MGRPGLAWGFGVDRKILASHNSCDTGKSVGARNTNTAVQQGGLTSGIVL